MSRLRDAAATAGVRLEVRRQTDMGSRRRQFQTDAHGKRTAVVLPISEYERLLEDVHDLAVVAERRDEPTMPLDQLKRRLAEGDPV